MKNQKAIEDCARRAMRPIVRKILIKELEEEITKSLKITFHKALNDISDKIELVYEETNGKLTCRLNRLDL